MPARSNRRAALLSALGVGVSAALAACGSTSPQSTGAQASTAVAAASSAPGSTIGLGHVGLIVADLDASLTFFRQLGLKIPKTLRGDYFRLKLPNGQIFFWDTEKVTRDFDPAYQSGAGDRRVVLEFAFRTPGEVDAMYDRLRAAGYKGYLTPRTMFSKTRYAIIEDPDRNQISLRFGPAS